MLTDIIMAQHREQLADALSDTAPAEIAPLSAPPDVTKSALQKGIRRGNTTLALQAAARLLIDNPQSLWRRLRLIAFEDVGVANLDAVAQTVVGAGSKRWRNEVGGEWTVASWLVQALAAAVKDRSADDLFVVLTYDPATLPIRHMIVENSLEWCLARTTDPDGNLIEHASAAWWVTGARNYPLDALPYEIDPTAYFDRLFDKGVCPTAVAIARTGFKATRNILSVLLPLLISGDTCSRSAPEIEAPPPVSLIGDMPSYVFDLYTRPGRRAIRSFLERNDLVRQTLIGLGVPPGKQAETLGGILFRLESAYVDRRLDWETGRGLRERADRCWLPGDPAAISDAFTVIRAQIPHLNAIREEGADGYHR